jgi:ribonuclease R
LKDALNEQIIDLLASAQGGPVPVVEVTRQLAPGRERQEELHRALDELITSGAVVTTDAGRALGLPMTDDQIVGIFHGTARGFGFVASLKHDPLGDLFIPPADTMEAITGDLVVARLLVTDKRDTRSRSRAGRIMKILRRGVSRCVGTLEKQLKTWVVIPDGTLFKQPVLVPDAGSSSATPGDKVVVELTEFPAAGKPAEGVIVEVLGPHGEPEVELRSVIRQFDLPEEFPPDVLQQARQAARDFETKSPHDREDITGELVITIDPDDARDFDDAISLRLLEPAGDASAEVDEILGTPETERPGSAKYELGVHIADVAHFVPADAPLDLEARRRGNSVYFPRYVVPMLPEMLSNGVCSLQEDKPRLTKSAYIRYDRFGRVVSTRFANTLIRSRRRLTYRQAQAIIDDMKGQGRPYSKGLLDSPPNPNIPDATPEVRNLLLNMDRLARAIQQRRLRQGMIVLDLPEVELVMDPEGHVIDAHPEDDSFTHKIIEMFMVEANEAVARFLTQRGLDVLRRVHPDPDQSASENVRNFVSAAGRRLPQQLDRHVIQELLDSVRGTPIAYAIHLSVLKTFNTAEYSPLPLGHYALASENYAHFTSPIRRYADLVIHRCLEAVLTKPGRKPAPARRKRSSVTVLQAAGTAGPAELKALMPQHLGDVPDYDTLLRLARHLSFTERRAQDAERELRASKVLQLLAEHIGDIIDGVVTGVNSSGIFVQSSRFLVEGMIRISDLPDDYWIYDERAMSLRGQRTGRKISLGDIARVQIVSVNISSRRMDLRLLEHGSTIHGDRKLRKVEPQRPPKPAKWHESTEPRIADQRRKPGGGKKRYNKSQVRRGRFRRGR